MDHQSQRDQLAQHLLDQAKEKLDQGSIGREALDVLKDELQAIAAHRALWGEEYFPAPPEGEQQNRYLIAQDDETGLSLYLNVMRPGKKIPPHNHTVFACVAAVDGVEINTVYDRVDDGSVPGKAELTIREVIHLRPGHALALMADDIHSVEINGTEIIRHLHFYGRPLETLDQRLSFDMAAGTCKIMDIGVRTKS